MLVGDVVGLARILGDVVEFDAAAVGVQEELPAALADREDRAPVPGVAGDREPPLPVERLGPLGGLALENGGAVLAVECQAGRDGGTTERREGGENVDACDHGVVDRAGGNAGAAHEEREPHTPFVEAAFAASEGPGLPTPLCEALAISIASGPLSEVKMTIVLSRRPSSSNFLNRRPSWASAAVAAAA